MARKRAKLRRGYGEGQIITIIPGEKYKIRASGGYDADGKRLRPARIIYGSEHKAGKALRELQRELDTDEYLAPSDMRFGDWLMEWLEAVGRMKAPGTYELYKRTAHKHIIPELGRHQLQRLRSTHLRTYFNDKAETLALSTLQQHYIIINSALDAAVHEGLIKDNPAKRMMGKPVVNKEDTPEEVLTNCWEEDEVLRFLAVAEQVGPQWAAFFHLALDTGMRKGELCGLMWRDIDWQQGAVQIQRALKRASSDPVFGRTKGRRARTLKIAPETLALLKTHRKHQAEIKLKVGPAYHDFGLVFAKEPASKRRDTIGCPLQANNIGQREYARIIEAAGIRPIKFHGLRHTCATHLLKRRAPVHYVSRRLGHKDELTTLRIYGHAIPSGEDDLVEDIRDFLGYTRQPQASENVPPST